MPPSRFGGMVLESDLAGIVRMKSEAKSRAHGRAGGKAPKPVEAATKRGQESGVSCLVVVGVGASAGGIEALKELVSNLPTGMGMAFVVVLHLDPRQKS